MNAAKRGVARKPTRTGMIPCPIPTATLFAEARTVRIQHISGPTEDEENQYKAGHAWEALRALLLVGQKLTGALLGAMQRVFELPMRTSTAKVRLK